MKKLYIRKAYEDLFTIICKNLEEKDIEKRLTGIAITGTPGIGKSMFLFYILWRLANMETTKTVIIHRKFERGGIYVFQNSGCWETFNYSDVAGLLKDDSTYTWYLTDTLEPSPARVKAVTILVSSPSEKYYSEFLEDSSVPPLHYLPVWSLEELKLTAESYSKSPEEVEKRFNMIGGIPRYVLEKDMDLEAMIDEKIGKLLSNNILQLPTFERAQENEISHRLVHFKVEPPCYTKYELVMASQYVREKYSEVREDRQEQLVRSFVSLFEDVSLVAASIGNMFEGYAHRQLSAG